MLNAPVIAYAKTLPSPMREVWQTLDLATFTCVRSLYTGPYPELKGKLPVRDTKERDSRAWNMREQIAGIWARAIRSLYDPIWSVPVIDRLREAIASAIVTAANHGAITASWRDTLLEHNRAQYNVMKYMPTAWVHYVDGKRCETYEELLTALGQDTINNPRMASRHEWKNRPGHPLSAPITPLSQDEGKPLLGRYDRWVPVREPSADVDIDRNHAVEAIGRAFYRFGQWS